MSQTIYKQEQRIRTFSVPGRGGHADLSSSRLNVKGFVSPCLGVVSPLRPPR